MLQTELQKVNAISFGWFVDFGADTLPCTIEGPSQLIYFDK